MKHQDNYGDSIMDFKPEAVVIDAGDYPRNPKARRWLEMDLPVVCCDGAADDFIEHGGMPWRIVGDGDSMSDRIRDTYSEIIRPNPDQETNDQTKAVTYLLRKGIHRIVILGATGKREDHTLGNISLLIEYMRMGVDARIYTDHGVFMAIEGERRFDCEAGTQVSIFNFGAHDIRSEGLKYPLRDFTSWWEGTLNEAPDGTFMLRAKGPLLVFICYPEA